jgi:hypothetical protein
MDKHVLIDINNCMKSIPAIGKNKTNTFQNFKYRAIDDIIDKVSDVLGENNLVLTFETLSLDSTWIESKSGKAKDVNIKIKYTFHSCIDASFVDYLIYASARDNSDKAEMKAYTAAYKTLLGQAFCIKFTEDPDSDYIETKGKITKQELPKQTIENKQESILDIVTKSLNDFKDGKKTINEKEIVLDVAYLDNTISKISKKYKDDVTLKEALTLLENKKQELKEVKHESN